MIKTIISSVKTEPEIKHDRRAWRMNGGNTKYMFHCVQEKKNGVRTMIDYYEYDIVRTSNTVYVMTLRRN